MKPRDRSRPEAGIDPRVWYGAMHAPVLGTVWTAVSPRGLIGLEFGIPQAAFVRGLAARGFERPEYAPGRVLNAGRQILEYVRGRRQHFDLVIDWDTLLSDFQRLVLQAVAEIPYGHTATYAELARRLDRPGAARAIGGANAANPMPIVIPCHRVIGSDGSLTGYGGSGGIRAKAWLLQLEKSHLGAPQSAAGGR